MIFFIFILLLIFQISIHWGICCNYQESSAGVHCRVHQENKAAFGCFLGIAKGVYLLYTIFPFMIVISILIFSSKITISASLPGCNDPFLSATPIITAGVLVIILTASN